MIRTSVLHAVGFLVLSCMFSDIAFGQDIHWPKAFQAKWKALECKICNKSAPRFSESWFEIKGNSQAEIWTQTGKWSNATLQKIDANVPSMVYLLVESGEDNPAMGGGGPRRAIARINAEGLLEILETRAADRGYPKNFKKIAKSDAVSWLFEVASE